MDMTLTWTPNSKTFINVSLSLCLCLCFCLCHAGFSFFFLRNKHTLQVGTLHTVQRNVLVASLFWHYSYVLIVYDKTGAKQKFLLMKCLSLTRSHMYAVYNDHVHHPLPQHLPLLLTCFFPLYLPHLHIFCVWLTTELLRVLAWVWVGGYSWRTVTGIIACSIKKNTSPLAAITYPFNTACSKLYCLSLLFFHDHL